MPEIIYNEEIPEGKFPIHLKLIKNINGQNPAFWINMNMARTIKVIFVEKVIYILTL